MSNRKVVSLITILLSLICLVTSMFVNEHSEITLLITAVIFYQYHISSRIDNIEEIHQGAMEHLVDQSKNWTSLLQELNVQEKKMKEQEKEQGEKERQKQ